MKKVIKENGVFHLLPDESLSPSNFAAKAHEADKQILKENPTLEQVVIILEHILTRLKAIERNG